MKSLLAPNRTVLIVPGSIIPCICCLMADARPGVCSSMDAQAHPAIETDAAITGIGEFYRGVQVQTVLEIAQGLMGADLFALNLQALPLPAGRLYDGFETAILDAVGKASGDASPRTSGRKVSRHGLLRLFDGHRTVADAARKAKEGQKKGFDCIKFKCAHTDPVVEWCQAIREACGADFKIILDPNQRFENIPTARRLADDLAAVGDVLCLEDPIARWDLESLAFLPPGHFHPHRPARGASL